MPFINPKDQTVQENYKLLIGSVVPRPIAFVSTISKNGVPNLAPFSFYTGVCSNPLTLCFCPSIRGSDGQKKDTLINIEETGEFIIHATTEAIAEKMNVTSAEFPSDVNEFDKAGLTPIAASIVKPFRVKESPIAFECKLNQIVTIAEGIGGGYLVIGEVVAVHIDDAIYENGRINLEKLQPIGRLAGASYCRVNDLFDLARPVIN